MATLVFCVGLVLALLGLEVLQRLARRLLSVASATASMAGQLVDEDVLSGVGDFVGETVGEHAGERADEVGARTQDLLRKSLVWMPSISFDNAMLLTLQAAGAPAFGSALYASLITLLAAALALALESRVGRVLRAAKAKGDKRDAKLAHDLSNIMSNALGVIVGKAWGGLATRTINPPVEEASVRVSGSNWSGLVVLAATTTACAVTVGLWVAEAWPSRQAKLIVGAQKKAHRRRAEAGKEMTHMAKTPMGAPPKAESNARSERI